MPFSAALRQQPQRVTGGACNGDAQLRTVAWRSVERLSHLILPKSHTLRGYVSFAKAFAKACKRPSVSSWCATQLSLKSAPRHCAREPFNFVWSLYRKILDHSTRVASHERTVETYTVLLRLTPTHIRSLNIDASLRFALSVCKRVKILAPG